jgi:Cu/Ag efflux pump CusA
MVLGSFLEVRGPLTFAAILVLLPIVPVYFMGDLFGAFGKPLATSYAIAVVVSTLVALTLTPALAVLLLSKTAHAGRQSALVTAVTRRYDGVVGRLLRAPSRAYVLAGVLAVIGLVALPQIRQSRLPALEERDFLMEVEAAPGTSLSRTNAITSEISGELRAIPGVRDVASHAGRAVTGDQVVGVNSSKLWISLDPRADYAKTVKAVKAVAANHRDLDLDLSSYSQSRIKDAKEGADAPIVVRVYGNERDALAVKAREVGDELRKISGITDLNVELPTEEPSLEVAVDLDRAKDFGVKPGDVRRSAAILLSGIDVGQLFYDQKVFDVVVWGAPETRQGTDDVKNLLIDTPTGGQVRLEQVADVNVVSSPDVIEREGVFRRIDVTARVSGRSREAVAADVEKAIKAVDFPLEYRAELLGDYAAKEAAERRLLGLGAFAGLAVLLLLQAAFGSWRVGAALFVTVPVSLVGGVAAALGLGGRLTIGAAIGLLTVLGVAGRHGILLIRRFQQLERREGLTFGAELVRRGATERLAPTLMSTAAIALALLPFAVLSHRPGFEILHPMAIVVLGGLVTATLVTVFILPPLYLTVAGGASATELDLRLFEEELLADTQPAPQQVTA